MFFKYLFPLCFSCYLLPATCYSQGTWVQKNNFGGAAREGAVAFTIGGKGYVGTGSGNFPLTSDFWEYDPVNDSWTQKSSFGGTPRFFGAGFSIGMKGYIGTGYDNVFRNDFWEYDPLSNSWTQLVNFPGIARWVATGFSIDSLGYLGTGGTPYQNDWWQFNPSTNTWTQMANFGGVPRYGCAGFVLGNKGYIGTGKDNTMKNDFWEFDPVTNSWTQKANFGGLPRYLGVGFSIGLKGYVGLGWDGTTRYSDIWEYDVTLNKWREEPNFGSGRDGAIAFTIDKCAYVCTGHINSDYLNDVWIYCPDSLFNCRIYLPNAFSPNADNENDIFIAQGSECIETFFLVIYNRWGEKVFETTDVSKGWDGNYNDRKESQGVFTYYLEATLISGAVIRRKGNVTLIR